MRDVIWRYAICCIDTFDVTSLQGRSHRSFFDPATPLRVTAQLQVFADCSYCEVAISDVTSKGNRIRLYGRLGDNYAKLPRTRLEFVAVVWTRMICCATRFAPNQT